MSDPAEKLPEEKLPFTYADYKAWELKQGERYEVIHGVAYAMAAPNANHQSILMDLSIQIGSFFRGKPCKVYPAPYDVRPFYEEDESDTTVVQPDIVVVCDKEKRGPEGCRGAPDLVVEILSPSNTAIEMERKFDVYREAGVREYWIVNPDSKTVHTYCFDVNKCYFYTAGDTAPVEIFPGLEIVLEPVFAE
jgi:Uma2 family endonuclease